MAKKKKTKDAEEKGFEYSVELTGLILICIGLIGFGFGPVGALLKKFSMFLLGEWWFCVLFLVLILGFFMLTKRKLPNFVSSKLLGFYILVGIVLILSHLSFIEQCNNPVDVFKNTIDNYMSRISTFNGNNALSSSGTTSIVIGGGILGAALSFCFYSLFGTIGTYIVLSFVAIFAIVLLFDINIGDMFTNVAKFFKSLKSEKEEKPKRDKKQHFEYEEDQEYEEKEDRIVITSVEELKNVSHRQTEVKETENIVSDPQQELLPIKEQPKITGAYNLPQITLLDDPVKNKKTNSNAFITSNQENLERVLRDFQIQGKVVEIHVGPAVTQYELTVPPGTRMNRISSISKEIALALAAKEVRIEAPIPGKSTVGVEIPNPVISAVKIKEILTTIPKSQENAKLLVALGKDLMGRSQTADLSKMPHLLIAGSTGSGKSVCVNTIIISILMRYRPDQVKLVLVDPKKVELSNYNGVPHLLCPVVTDPKRASLTLQKVVDEMERRFELFSEKGVKNIESYNEWVQKQNEENPEAQITDMYYLVVIIDELADLMMVASKEVEDSIMRITQLARAAGIHLIVATQRPSTDIITGVVKTNIPSRIAFKVASYIDSRTILDCNGAEKLLGKGDMLFLPMGENTPIRIQGCYVSDDEIRRVIDHVCHEQVARYDEEMTTNLNSSHLAGATSEKEEYDDPLYDEIVEFAVTTGKISASLLQRRFRLGYNRAARIIDLLEERGIIGPQNGSKPREVLIKVENKEE